MSCRGFGASIRIRPGRLSPCTRGWRTRTRPRREARPGRRAGAGLTQWRRADRRRSSVIRACPGYRSCPWPQAAPFWPSMRAGVWRISKVAVLDRLQTGKIEPRRAQGVDHLPSADPELAPFAAPALLHALDHHRRAAADAVASPGAAPRVPAVPKDLWATPWRTGPAMLRSPWSSRPTTRRRTCPA